MRWLYGVFQPRFTAGVVGVIFDAAGRILVVEHVFHPICPWGLPGGWLSRGENPAEGLVREVREETRMLVTIVCPLLIETGIHAREHFDISYLCLANGDVGALSDELLAYQWAEPGALPPMLRFHTASVVAAQTRRLQEVE
jgi:ADP-ribose pyrophosphatase YjhB (NUDIX family)